MLYIAIAAGICLFVPGAMMWFCSLFSKDLPNPILPSELTKTTTAEKATPKASLDVQAAASVPAAAAVEDEETDHPPKPHGGGSSGRGGVRVGDEETVHPPKPRSFKRSYQWYNILMIPVFLILMGGGTVGWSFVLCWLYLRRMAELPPSVHLVEPGWGLMITPALFLGIFTPILPMDLLTRLFLRRRYHDYEEWEQGRMGLPTRADARAFLFRFGLLFGVPLALCTSLAMDWYSRFGEEEIAVNRLFSAGERAYSYSQVRHIVVTTHFRNPFGQVVPANRYSIVFDDGCIWCNQDMIGANTRLQQDREVLQFVSRKSGKPVVQARLIEDVVE